MSRITELLDQYGFWDGMVKKKRVEIERHRDRKTSIQTRYTDAHGGEPESMEEYMAQHDLLERDLAELKKERMRAFSAIMQVAFKLRSKQQFDMIYRRNIHRDGWRRICRDLAVSRGAATDLHTRAVKAMEEIDKDLTRTPK